MPIVRIHLIRKCSYFCDVQHFKITEFMITTLHQDTLDFCSNFPILWNTYNTDTIYRRLSITSYLTMVSCNLTYQIRLISLTSPFHKEREHIFHNVPGKFEISKLIWDQHHLEFGFGKSVKNIKRLVKQWVK